MQYLKYALISYFILFLAMCSDNNRERPGTACESVACTQNFVTLFITLEDPSGVNIPLDSLKVSDTETMEDITPEFTQQELQKFREQGLYPLYNDSHKLEHLNSERLITFKGFINSMTVVMENYVVAADCCHVRLVSGDQSPIIE